MKYINLALSPFNPLPAVTLAESKRAVGYASGGQDELFNDLIIEATAQVETFLGRSLLRRSITMTFQPDEIRWGEPLNIDLPRPPIVSITSINIRTRGLPIAITDYWEASRSVQMQLPAQPDVAINPLAAFEIVYLAGSASISDVPNDIRRGIIGLVAHYFVYRSLGSKDDTQPMMKGGLPTPIYHALLPWREVVPSAVT